MSNALIQLIVLAAIAIFLILRLRNVLGTRDGFEPDQSANAEAQRRNFEVIDGTADEVEHDVFDYVERGSPAAGALTAMHEVEPSFSVGEFLSGAKGAHEMILMAFEKGDLDDVRPFLGDQIAEAFQSVIDARKAQSQTVEAQYLGTRESAISSAEFDRATGMAEVSVHFVSELIVATRDAAGNVIEGDPKASRKQRDLWTFARHMGQNDPNWQLVATG